MSFKESLIKVLEQEGGYVNDPLDSGGETYKGISRRWFPKWDGWAIIDSLDKNKLDNSMELQEKVSNFYYKYFWESIKANEIRDKFIASMLFNFSINMGKKVVVRKAQRVAKVTQDGIIGKNTLRAINTMNSELFVYHFLLEIIEFYIQIGKKQPHYLQGWLNRAISFYYCYEKLVK